MFYVKIGSTCANCNVFKIHLGRLSQIAIDTHGLVLFSKNSIGCQLNVSVLSKQPLWFIRFFTVVTQTISALVCLFVVEGMAQDTTAQIRGSSLILPIYIQIKNHFGHSFAFDAPTLWNDLPDDISSAPTLACFSKKLKSYLFDKAFPP